MIIVGLSILADFFLFLFACQQWRVFVLEMNDKNQAFVQAGGSNREIIYDVDIYKNNPTWDFVTNRRHWLDQIKYAIFMYGVCECPLDRLSRGNDENQSTRSRLSHCLFLFPLVRTRFSHQTRYRDDSLVRRFPCPIDSFTEWTLFRWNYLIYYCFAVVFLKACLQVGLELVQRVRNLLAARSNAGEKCTFTGGLPVWVFSPLNVLCNRSLPLLVSIRHSKIQRLQWFSVYRCRLTCSSLPLLLSDSWGKL